MMNQQHPLLPYLKKYYSNGYIRSTIDVIYILNEVLLALYLLFIPIQVAYYWLLRSPDNAPVQTGIDIGVTVLFGIHIFLYFDQKFLQILKNPYAIWHRKLLTLQLFYDVTAFLLAIVMIAVVHRSILERAIELVFFLKVAKLVKFDVKCMSVVVGTAWYKPYKVFRTLLIVFMAIAYVGSLFYGVAYYLYTQGIQYQYLLWIVSTGAIQDCVNQPFIIQLQYAMYWALGTASTAAYGDISAAQPTVVLVNILALAFEGFLFGFYLNSMHSIPAENSQKQADLLQKFDSFQQHSSNRKLDNKLYLQILCSLQYSQSKKRSLESIEKLMPRKYIQQIKYNMYADFLDDGEFFPSQQLRMAAAECLKEIICEVGEDVFRYRSVRCDDLVYLKEGTIQYYLAGELEYITKIVKKSDECLGVFQFLTGLQLPERAICKKYCSLYIVSRSDYKQLLSEEEKLDFYERGNKCAQSLQGYYLIAQPIMKYTQCLEFNSSQIITYNLIKRQEKCLSILSEGFSPRTQFQRQGKMKSDKILLLNPKKRSMGVQTEREQKQIAEVVWGGVISSSGRQIKN